MSKPVLYHFDRQYASGLLRPVAAELRALESRLAHYLDHLRLDDADRGLISEAHSAVAQAAAVVDRLWQSRSTAGEEVGH